MFRCVTRNICRLPLLLVSHLRDEKQIEEEEHEDSDDDEINEKRMSLSGRQLRQIQ